MARFQFRFDAVMRLRETVRDEARKRVAEAERAYDLLGDELNNLQSEREQYRTGITTHLIGTISVNGLLDHGRYDLQVAAKRQQLTGQRGQILEEIERRRQRLALAEQEYRKFEKLREIAVANHERLELVKQQALLDEIASQRHGREER